MSSSPSVPPGPECVYHVELRHFPRNLCRFNLSGVELRATVIEPWLADRVFELGELKWDPRHARLTVLEGPRLPPEQLSMGRGWRAAQRQSRDVTEQLLAAAGTTLARAEGEAQGSPPASAGAAAPTGRTQGARTAPAAAPGPGSGETGLLADSLGLELLARMGSEPTPLRRAWDLASARDPSRPASDALAIAERAVASLLKARLITMSRAPASEPTPEAMREEEIAAVLRAPESWAGERVWLRRA